MYSKEAGVVMVLKQFKLDSMIAYSAQLLGSLWLVKFPRMMLDIPYILW